MHRRTVLRAGLAAAALPWVPAGDPPPAAPISRIALGSCLRDPDGGAILDRIVDQRPDLMLWLGDSIYADTDDPARIRALWARLGANPRVQRLRAACTNLAVWDDHDYGQDNIGTEYVAKQASQQAFCDFWQVPADDPRRTRVGVYHAAIVGPPGRRVQVILLDGRYFRSAHHTGKDPAGTMLGPAQWTWLAHQLRVPAELRLICSGIQVLHGYRGEESWLLFPHERQRLLDMVRTSSGAMAFLSGDMHFSEVVRVDGALPHPVYELTASGLDQRHPPPPNPQRLGAPVTGGSFGMVEIAWGEAPVLRLRTHDATGAVVADEVSPWHALRC